MQNDTIIYDTLNNRPLPKWLVDQKKGLTTIQPKKIIMKDDKSLNISFALTGVFILMIVFIISIYIIRKYKNQS
jgi:hypothetical protein